MAHIVCEAIEILTDNGTGIPLTYSNTAVGLPAGGRFYLITDRPGLNGSKTITGDTSQTTWYEGILSRDYSAFLPSRSCDFVEFGGIEMVSGMSFSIVNTAAFWKTLQDNSIYLGNCVVKYYRVTSSDDVTYNFELRWTGVIDDQPFNELTYSVRCVDNSKSILQNAPIDSVDAIRFPLAPQNSLAKTIPLALGRVAKSPMVSVSNPGSKTMLAKLTGDGNNTIGDVPFYVAAAIAPGYTAAPATPKPADGGSSRPVFYIYTPGVNFSASDTRLVSKFLVVIAGGASQAPLIVDNTATSATAITTLYLSENLDVSTPFKSWNGTMSQTDKDIWYVQVVDYSATLIPSTQSIFQFIKSGYGTSLLSTYDNSLKAYSDISDSDSSSSTSNINYLNYPGFYVFSKSADASGALNFYTYITPKNILVALKSGSWTGDLPAVGVKAGRLFDRQDGLYYTLSSTAALNGDQFFFDVFLPSDDVLKSYSDLYLLPDLSHQVASGNETITLKVSAAARDIYGRTTTADVMPSYTVMNSVLNASSGLVDLFRLPGSYFNRSRDDRAFYFEKSSFSIQSLIGDAKKASVYNIVRFQINMITTGGTTYTMLLKELGLVGKRSVSFASDVAYSSLIGEMFGSTWSGRKIATSPCLTIADALEKIIRDYNLAKNVWGVLKAYSIGDKVRSIADNGHLYVCTVAGTSGANAAITGAANNGAGLIRITSAAHGMATGNKITITGVVGTTEANGSWTITVISSSTYDLQSSTFTHAYTSGGTVVVNFPTGSGAIVTDGTVTWTEAGLIPIDTTTFDTLSSQRSTWFVGRTLTEKKATVDYITEMAKQGFFIVLTDATGKIKAKAWRENTTALATFSSSNIIPGTLLELKPTPMRRVSNDLTVKYDENPGSSGFNKQIVVTNINRPTFPSNTETLVTGTNLGSFTITSNIDIVGNYYFTITTTAAHGLSTGAIVSLTGNTDGYNFTPRAIAVLNTTQISVSPGQITTASSSSSGTLYSNPVSTLKWQTFVSGVINYTTAKGIWSQCHNSFVLTKRVQKLATADGECKWFIDPLAKDPGGNYIWSDTVTPTYDITNVADDHPAVFYAKNLSEWTAWQKKQATFETIDTAALSVLEIGDPVYLNDTKLTNGSNLLGWIHEKTQLAKTDKLPYRFRFGITLNPEQLNVCNRIIDTNASANRILDTNASANRVLDVPC